MYCEVCGELLVAGARVCGACGKPIDAFPDATVFCAACGASAPDRARFCPNCGRVLAAPTEERAVPGPTEGPPQALYAAPAQPSYRQPVRTPYQAPHQQAPYQAGPRAAVSAELGGEYAGFWTRFGARLLDTLIVIAISLIPAIIVGVIAFQAVYPDDQLFVSQQQEDNAFAAAFWSAWAVWMVVAVVYAIVGWAQGGTWGMRALGLRIIRRSTSDKPGVGPAIARYLVSIVSSWPLYLGFLWMLWDDAKQTWHDKAADTIVVYQR